MERVQSRRAADGPGLIVPSDRQLPRRPASAGGQTQVALLPPEKARVFVLHLGLEDAAPSQIGLAQHVSVGLGGAGSRGVTAGQAGGGCGERGGCRGRSDGDGRAAQAWAGKRADHGRGGERGVACLMIVSGTPQSRSVLHDLCRGRVSDLGRNTALISSISLNSTVVRGGQVRSAMCFYFRLVVVQKPP